MDGMGTVSRGVYIGLALSAVLVVLIGGPALIIGDAIRGDFTSLLAVLVGVPMTMLGLVAGARSAKTN